ncbi:hypothetical protein BT93_L0961 [Corymbia citriodora subsp. variegata]|uniref:Trichome birefringence-like N-terminal domain-containing protein n=1 Tax=Corymbia citriodora subsp. variegata TaxID=360336 RepID=A0A8T0CTA6_CORYI|nr:hypothetical protein BT93_L0961 [Corymbia citriodora subsp. variegata]
MANRSQVAAIASPTWTSSVTGSFHSLVALLVAVLVVSALFLSRDQPLLGSPTPTAPTRQCDLFSGRWVYDNVSYPLYKEKQCRYMSREIACEAYGRKDLKYQQWRWQPHGCDLPRFNATALLEKLRNKRLVYVGDSLNRGQWHSMVCMVEAAIPPALKSMSDRHNASLRIFKAHEYNATIEFYWAPLLVETNCDDPKNHSIYHRIVRVRAIENHAKHWHDADFLIFNTYLWWRLPEMELLAGEWGGIPGGSCYGETELITREGYWGTGSVLSMMRVVERVVKKLEARGITIHILNITQLSEYRKEAHPTIHRKHWHPLTKEQLANPVSYADCFHWCLPGLQDVWNELLYTYIFHILDA